MQNKKTKNKDLHLGSNLYNFRIGIKSKQWCIAILTHCDLFDMTSFHVKSCMLRNDATSVSVSKLSKMATTLCFFLPNKRTRLENDLFFQKRGWNSFTLITRKRWHSILTENKSSDIFFSFFIFQNWKLCVVLLTVCTAWIYFLTIVITWKKVMGRLSWMSDLFIWSVGLSTMNFSIECEIITEG